MTRNPAPRITLAALAGLTLIGALTTPAAGQANATAADAISRPASAAAAFPVPAGASPDFLTACARPWTWSAR